MLKVKDSNNRPFSKAAGALLRPGLHPHTEGAEEIFGCMVEKSLICVRTAPVPRRSLPPVECIWSTVFQGMPPINSGNKGRSGTMASLLNKRALYFISDTYILPLHWLSLQLSNLFNPLHRSLRVPRSLAEVNDSEPHQRHLPAVSSDAWQGSSGSNCSQISNLSHTCPHSQNTSPKMMGCTSSFLRYTKTKDLN